MRPERLPRAASLVTCRSIFAVRLCKSSRHTHTHTHITPGRCTSTLYLYGSTVIPQFCKTFSPFSFASRHAVADMLTAFVWRMRPGGPPGSTFWEAATRFWMLHLKAFHRAPPAPGTDLQLHRVLYDHYQGPGPVHFASRSRVLACLAPRKGSKASRRVFCLLV